MTDSPNIDAQAFIDWLRAAPWMQPGLAEAMAQAALYGNWRPEREPVLGAASMLFQDPREQP